MIKAIIRGVALKEKGIKYKQQCKISLNQDLCIKCYITTQITPYSMLMRRLKMSTYVYTTCEIISTRYSYLTNALNVIKTNESDH